MWRTSALEQRTFREHERSLRSPFQGAADYKLRVTEAVGSGGIDPVDPVLERMVDRSDRCSSSWVPQPCSQSPPPSAHAPNPTRVISRPVLPSWRRGSFGRLRQARLV
jgi:hypothetical protein